MIAIKLGLLFSQTCSLFQCGYSRHDREKGTFGGKHLGSVVLCEIHQRVDEETLTAFLEKT